MTRITTDQIEALSDLSPRRKRIRDDFPLIKRGFTHYLDFRFSESFQPLLISQFPTLVGPTTESYRYKYPLHRISTTDYALIEVFLHSIESVVIIRDVLDASFALDYAFLDGDPNKERTRVGDLVRRLKNYGSTDKTFDEQLLQILTNICMQFISKCKLLSEVDAVAVVPGSRPNRQNYLPEAIAKRIAVGLDVPYLGRKITTKKDRSENKEAEPKRKLRNIIDNTNVASLDFRNKKVLLIDDLYQSGISINTIGKMLGDAGASSVIGLCFEKACRN